MNNDMKKSIVEMAGGGFIERIDYEIPGVIRNIMDPNTPVKTKRKITVTFEFSTDETRQNLAVQYTVKPTLASTKPLTTFLYVVDEETIVEMLPQIPGQQKIEGPEQEQPAYLKIVKNA